MKRFIIFLGVILCLGVLSAAPAFPQDLELPYKQDLEEPYYDEGGYKGPIHTPVPPHANLNHESILATLWLPDPVNGFYYGTRFDWSSMIGTVGFKGYRFFEPWYVKADRFIEDIQYHPDLDGYVVDPNSAGQGVMQEFGTGIIGPPPGWEESPVDGTFLKIGVGILRKPGLVSRMNFDTSEIDLVEPIYNSVQAYEIVNGGKWTVEGVDNISDDFIYSIKIVHELDDPASGYGYVYTKTVTLVQGQPEMVMEHSLRNTGRKIIDTDVCRVHYFTMNDQPIGPWTQIKWGFPAESDFDAERKPGYFEFFGGGSETLFDKELKGKESLEFEVKGFEDVDDPMVANWLKFKNRQEQAEVLVSCDLPLLRAMVRAIRPVAITKMFSKIRVAPGQEINWRITFRFNYVPYSEKVANSLPGRFRHITGLPNAFAD